MDFSELTKVLFDRIKKVESENAIKILGCLFLTTPDEERMSQLAVGTDEDILSVVNEAKMTLKIFLSSTVPAFPAEPATDYGIGRQFASFSNSIRQCYLSTPPVSAGAQAPSSSNQFAPNLYSDSISSDESSLPSHSQFLSLEGHEFTAVHAVGHGTFGSNHYHREDGLGSCSPTSRTSRRTVSLGELPFKACHYFHKGYCKHGGSCSYYHGHLSLNDYSLMSSSSSMNEMTIEDHDILPGSLEKLEMELAELLKERRGIPVSIASLPMLYFEKYGRTLQAEGYLTESQRHGKAGFSLTKLLARLNKSIWLIDRPHGQHSVILAEDAPKCMEYRNDGINTGASSRQIYLTFPADSTFTEDDVSNYFKQYGPVSDVRIPCQDKRMFGFVSFDRPETVKLILSERNPHYISGARVLVKQYKEKSKIINNRSYMEKVEPGVYPYYPRMDPVTHAMQRESGRSRVIRRQQLEEQEKLAELEQRRLSELNLTSQLLSRPSYFVSSMEAVVTEDHFSHALDASNNVSPNNNKSRHCSNSHGDQESGQIDLPDSPFASHQVGSSISAVI